MIIAYLAPEIPARSATFVYEEIHELERTGHIVVPFSLHVPTDPAPDQSAIADRTTYLYQHGYGKTLLKGFVDAFRPGSGVFKALPWLWHDIRQISAKQAVKLGFQFLAAITFARYLKQSGCEHLHVHFAHVPTQVAMYAAKMADIPFTLTSHANDIFERALLLKVKAERAKAFYTISDYNLAYLKQLGLSAAKLGIVRCGVSFAYRKKAPHLTVANNEIVIGSLGRLVEKKGMDVLIRAIFIVKKLFPDTFISLQIAGDGPLKPSLMKLVSDLALTETVIFKGAVPHSDVTNWLDTLDVFVLACKQDSNGDMDGIPVVLMEAMSQSVPVISTRLSGIPELIIHNETGLLAEPGSAESLADAITQLLGKPQQLTGITDKALQHVMNEFSLESNVQRLISGFQS